MAHHKKQRLHKVRRAACNAYVSPAENATVAAFQSTELQWNPDCFSSYDNLDIYLYSVGAAQDIHIWKGVPKTPTSLNTSLNAAWWAYTTGTTQMQLVIAGADQPSWAGSAPGPIFSATFDGNVPDSASTSAAPAQTNGPSVDDLSPAPSSGIAGGKLAAAVAVPILAVIAAVVGYVLYSRRRTGQASKR